MDWLKGMNDVLAHIEENLTQPIKYEQLSRIVGCSVYEFSRIFSFMAGMSISEYIRRRRLSQAVFDIQTGRDKIIDISQKYCYESQASFTRAFKELHGVAPAAARKVTTPLKTCPPITFILTIKGVNEMDFRIEKMDSFTVMGLSGHLVEGETWEESLWGVFLDEPNGDGPGTYNVVLREKYYTPPFYQVGVYDFQSYDGKTPLIIGAEFKGSTPDIKGLSFKTVPAATWAVFSIKGVTGPTAYAAAWTRIMTEWLPQSSYTRNTAVPNLDVYPANAIDENYVWEIWLPVLSK